MYMTIYFGEDADLFSELSQSSYRVKNLSEAVHYAAQKACSGDIVLLSARLRKF